MSSGAYTVGATADDLEGELGSLAALMRQVAATPALDPGLARSYARLEQLPVRLDGFELRAEIGRGGMGRVFRGRDLALERDVAIKVLRPSTRAPVPASAAAIAREAVRTAALDHPGIVAVFGHGVADELPYLVMELVDGEALSVVMARRPPGRRALAGFAADGLAALAHAHARGLVHRDIKPENLIVTAAGRTRVLDFGIADLLSEPGDASMGVLAGTPAYMAPERWRDEPATPASDVWAFALVLLEAATTPSLRRARRRGAHPAAPAVTTAHPRHRARSPARGWRCCVAGDRGWRRRWHPRCTTSPALARTRRRWRRR